MSQGANALFNLIAVIFVVLTGVALLVVIGVAADAIDPPFFAPEPTIVLPTLASDIVALTPSPYLPSWTPSPGPSDTPTPTITYTPSFTPTPRPSQTNTPGPTPTRTPWPTETPTHTPTFTPTMTFTPSPTGLPPTATNTLTPFAFIIQPGTPNLRANFANQAGCNWQGVAGQAVTQTGDAVIGVQVRVWGDSIGELFTITGTNSFYGPSGWEMPLDSKPNNLTYR
ncbi:MAG: hypothetical protein JW910_16600, partial [Anaerolineae bacterium]|nr:hypothetical protein [Anaerolineae bacterium]